MTKRYLYQQVTLLIFTLAIIGSCNNKNDNPKAPATNNQNTTAKKEEPAEPKRPPVINIVDTVTQKCTVLCMKDSAATFERIGLKLEQIYGNKLSSVLTKNKWKAAGAPMAWYKSNKAPYFFEAGIPVVISGKKPAKLPPGIYFKEIGTDSAVVAHFTGPYDLLSQGYEVLRDWLKEHKKKSTSPPFEIYVGDAVDKEGKAIDPYKVQTDIIFPRR